MPEVKITDQTGCSLTTIKFKEENVYFLIDNKLILMTCSSHFETKFKTIKVFTDLEENKSYDEGSFERKFKGKDNCIIIPEEQIIIFANRTLKDRKGVLLE